MSLCCARPEEIPKSMCVIGFLWFSAGVRGLSLMCIVSVGDPSGSEGIFRIYILYHYGRLFVGVLMFSFGVGF